MKTVCRSQERKDNEFKFICSLTQSVQQFFSSDWHTLFVFMKLWSLNFMAFPKL